LTVGFGPLPVGASKLLLVCLLLAWVPFA